jgi:hypothetical protein
MDLGGYAIIEPNHTACVSRKDGVVSDGGQGWSEERLVQQRIARPGAEQANLNIGCWQMLAS